MAVLAFLDKPMAVTQEDDRFHPTEN